MKCDNLVKYGMDDPTIGDDYEMYRVADVDAAIAELKAENERLVKCCKEYDSRQRIDERIKSNGAQQLRATKRALWLARAWGANQRTKYLDLFLTGRAHAIRKYKWIKITSKCRAKAEEY